MAQGTVVGVEVQVGQREELDVPAVGAFGVRFVVFAVDGIELGLGTLLGGARGELEEEVGVGHPIIPGGHHEIALQPGLCDGCVGDEFRCAEIGTLRLVFYDARYGDEGFVIAELPADDVREGGVGKVGMCPAFGQDDGEGIGERRLGGADEPLVRNEKEVVRSGIDDAGLLLEDGGAVARDDDLGGVLILVGEIGYR